MIHPIQILTVPPLLKLVWIKEIEGLGNIPADGRFIATPNHQSLLDDWIPSSLIVPHIDKELHMYVNRKYFSNILFRCYLRNHKAIPVEVYGSKDRKEVNERAFKKALSYLKDGEPICIYPEGHRSLDGELQKAKDGAARLALAAKVPVLPFGIIGSRDVLPKGNKIPRLKKVVSVKIGKPLYLSEYYGRENDKNVLGDITRMVMKEIGKLIGKRYRY